MKLGKQAARMRPEASTSGSENFCSASKKLGSERSQRTRQTLAQILSKRPKDTIFRLKTLYLLGQKRAFLGAKDSIFLSKSLYLSVRKTVSFTHETLYLSVQKTVSFKPKDCIFQTKSLYLSAQITVSFKQIP
ncbi:MAG: hypothetical protein HDR37_06395 [Treponema sp.]|nr:hypothetical protein [Treponema sp.]MBD5438179.1 hypothetical protein [Treponema sp.]